MTPDERLDRYSRLAVEVAVNLQPGQFLRVSADPEHLPLVRAIGRVAYERGARYVEVLIGDAAKLPGIGRLLATVSSPDDLQSTRRMEK